MLYQRSCYPPSLPLLYYCLISELDHTYPHETRGQHFQSLTYRVTFPSHTPRLRTSEAKPVRMKKCRSLRRKLQRNRKPKEMSARENETEEERRTQSLGRSRNSDQIFFFFLVSRHTPQAFSVHIFLRGNLKGSRIRSLPPLLLFIFLRIERKFQHEN